MSDGAAEESAGQAAMSSVAKAAALLRALAHSPGGQGRVSDLAGTAGMAKSTAHRVLAELHAEGLVGRDGSRYRLGPAWSALSEAARLTEHRVLRDRAGGPLEELFEQRRATVHLGVLDDREVLYLEKLTGAGGIGIPSRVGSRNPATCTALGKAMLAFSDATVVTHVLHQPLSRLGPRSITARNALLADLAAARRRGFSRESGEARDGLACVAAPVLADGRMVAGVSLCRTADHVPSETDAAAVRLTAHRIGELIAMGS